MKSSTILLSDQAELGGLNMRMLPSSFLLFHHSMARWCNKELVEEQRIQAEMARNKIMNADSCCDMTPKKNKN